MAAFAVALELLPLISDPTPGTAEIFGKTFDNRRLFGYTASTVARKGEWAKVIPEPVTYTCSPSWNVPTVE